MSVSIDDHIATQAAAIMELKAEINRLKAEETAQKDTIRDMMLGQEITSYATPDSFSVSLYQTRVAQKIKKSDSGYTSPSVVRNLKVTLPDGKERRLFSLDLLLRLCSVGSDGVSDVVKAKYLSEGDTELFVKDRIAIDPSLLIRPKVRVK